MAESAGDAGGGDPGGPGPHAASVRLAVLHLRLDRAVRPRDRAALARPATWRHHDHRPRPHAYTPTADAVLQSHTRPQTVHHSRSVCHHRHCILPRPAHTDVIEPDQDGGGVRGAAVCLPPLVLRPVHPVLCAPQAALPRPRQPRRILLRPPP